MEQEYGVSVLPLNCEQLKREDVERILAEILKEFPVTELDFYVPKWLEILPDSHPLKQAAIERAKTILSDVSQMKDVREEVFHTDGDPGLEAVVIGRMEMSDGKVSAEMKMTRATVDPKPNQTSEELNFSIERRKTNGPGKRRWWWGHKLH